MQLPVSQAPTVKPASAVRTTGKVLIVEDETELAHMFATMLRAAGFESAHAADGRVALNMLRENAYDLVLTDLTMPHMDGMELLRNIREIDDELPVVIMTAAPALESAIRAVEFGVLRYLQKPVRSSELIAVTRQALTLNELAHMKRQALALMNESASKLSDLNALEVTFQKALDELYMAFQPILCWSKRSIVGYEALVRSRSTELSNPATLFSAAHKVGRFHDLGRRIRQLGPEALYPTPHKLFLNVDALDLEDDTLFNTHSLFADMADRIVLELTERISLDGIMDAYERVAQLRAKGYAIAIDDLGAGYAGLSYFGAIEPDLCKLDMSLVRDIHLSPTKQAIVAGMVRMCNDLDITLICEGVETRAELEALLRLDCDVFQGYLFARPSAELGPVSW
jgi:EAL domain-containing protein (putative c-di-GMP-specific phosphodiesterase class I)/CheY-like chemotaxis protein